MPFSPPAATGQHLPASGAATMARKPSGSEDEARLSRTLQKRLLDLSLAVRATSVAALCLASVLQSPFDSSHHLLALVLDPSNPPGRSFGPLASWLTSFVRWDTVYFVALASPYPVDLRHAAASHPAQGSAQGGYTHEQMLAFQPGIVALLRITGQLTSDTEGAWSPIGALALTTLLANLAAWIAPLLLFQLTLRHTASLRFAWLSAALSVFSPAAGTVLSSPTPEPFFSLFALLGMLSLAPPRPGRTRNGAGTAGRVKAALCFAVATSFRANGVLLSGFLLWDLFWAEKGEEEGAQQRSWSTAILSTILDGVQAAVLVALSIAPLVLSQLWAYHRFCLVDASQGPRRPWCEKGTRSVYAFVQEHYWDVGLFRYWRPEQVPNFLLAAPVLALLGWAVLTFFAPPPLPSSSSSSSLAGDTAPSRYVEAIQILLPTALRSRSPSPPRVRSGAPLSLDRSPSLTPHIVLSAVLLSTLLFASHVQIALRFATPGGMPGVWWALASLCLASPSPSRGQAESRKEGGRGFGDQDEVDGNKRGPVAIAATTQQGASTASGGTRSAVVLGWLAVWYACSIVLYAGFYPPA